jgi:hypothetical protein
LIPSLRLDRLAFGDVPAVVDLRRLQRDPLRTRTAERVAVDHVAEDVDHVAADVGPGREDQEREDRQPHPARRSGGRAAEPQPQREQVDDQGDKHQ